MREEEKNEHEDRRRERKLNQELSGAIEVG